MRCWKIRGASGSELGFAHAALLAAVGVLNVILVLARMLGQQTDDGVKAYAPNWPWGAKYSTVWPVANLWGIAPPSQTALRLMADVLPRWSGSTSKLIR